MSLSNEEKTVQTPNQVRDRASTGSSASIPGITKTSAIKLSAKEQIQAEHLAPWDNYKAEKGTEGNYHILVEQVVIKDLDYKSSPHVVQINKSGFQRYMATYQGLALTLHKILHDPQPDKTPGLIDAAMEQVKLGKLR